MSIKPVDKGEIDRVVTTTEAELLIEFSPMGVPVEFDFGPSGMRLKGCTKLLEEIREEFALNEMRRFQF